jgi:hypothetical protein
MPEFLRTLLALLALATIVFAFAKVPACAVAMTPADYLRRRNLWFGITLTVFFAHNYWIYILVVGVILLLAIQKEKNRLALFFVLLFAVPPIPNEIGGLGMINFFFTIDYLRLVALTILLPTYLHLLKQKDTEKFGRHLPDKLLAGYLILQLLLIQDVSTLTNTLRLGVFYPFLGIFLPYYVASRSVRSLEDFRAVLMAFVIAALVLSAIGIFEYARHWLLYDPLEKTLDVNWKLSRYLAREAGGLRAQASTGQPIPLGFVIAVAMGFFLYLKKVVPDGRRWALGMILLAAGLFSPISRGPWVGAAIMLLFFLLTGPNPGRKILRLGIVGIVAIPVLMATPAGEKIIGYLPWVGHVEAETVDFREMMLLNSIDVILRNPLFGGFDYMYSTELQEMATGSGFIDIVNNYVGIALAQGLVGLSLFVGTFAAILLNIVRSMRKIRDKEDELYILGQSLFSVLIGVLVIIGTVSSISVIPVVYWSIAGLGVAYARILESHVKANSVQPLQREPSQVDVRVAAATAFSRASERIRADRSQSNRFDIS